MEKSRRQRTCLGLGLLLALPPTLGHANPYGGRVPDEYESSGGHSLGFSNAGSAAVSGQGSVKNNPAMLAVEKQYTLHAGYHWPSFGREYYQAGAVDSKTSPVAAGFTYTSSREKFQGVGGETSDEKRLSSYYDSPIKYRASLGVAQAFSYLAVGLGVQYVEGFASEPPMEGYQMVKGATFGLGLAGLLTPSLRYGFSAENMANSTVKDLAPRIYRGGVAYTVFDGDFTAHVDYVQRQRVPQELAPEGELVDPFATHDRSETIPGSDWLARPEQMVVTSFSARIQDLIRLLGSYGHELNGPRRMLSGGVALVNQNFSLSYLASQPYMSDTRIHHALSLSMQAAL